MTLNNVIIRNANLFYLKEKLSIMRNYGAALKEARKANGYTQEQVQKATNIPQSNISAWENGTNLPNIDFCIQLADFYGNSLDELLGRDFVQRNNN